jgi:hypothetical protein
MNIKPAWLLALTGLAIVAGIIAGSWVYRLAAGG